MEKWTNIGSIASETSKGTKYGIDVNEDGTLLRCHCMSYVHSKDTPKSCKHVLSSAAGTLLDQHNASKVPARHLYIGAITATLLRPGEAYRQASYITPAVILSRTDFEKLSFLVQEAKNAVHTYSVIRLRSMLRNIGIY